MLAVNVSMLTTNSSTGNCYFQRQWACHLTILLYYVGLQVPFNTQTMLLLYFHGSPAAEDANLLPGTYSFSLSLVALHHVCGNHRHTEDPSAGNIKSLVKTETELALALSYASYLWLCPRPLARNQTPGLCLGLFTSV